MSSTKHCAGLIYGAEFHHLDHIGPLCLLMHMPLIVTEEKMAQLAVKYYPGIQIVTADYLTLAEYLVSHFDVIFYSFPRDLFDELFFFAQKLLQKKVHTVWCPHGNSDKGHSIFYMEALKKEEVALVYGKQMIDFLQKKGAYEQLKAHVVVGNYRHALYQEHKEFYDQIAEREITRRMRAGKRTILYAPTWQDYEKSGSFFDAMPYLAEKMSEDTNLIVKLHPNLLLQHDSEVEELLDQYRSLPGLLFLTDFPPIYPLLNLVDIYLGDMSSIGYDFLTFDRPMFFLNQNRRDSSQDPGLYLFRCGIEIKREDYTRIYEVIDNFLHFELRPFSPIRKDVYTYAFGHPKTPATVRKEIEHALEVFPEKDLSFY